MRRIFASFFLSGLIVFTGCSTGLNAPTSQTSALTTGTLNAQGIVHGGKQPVSGSTIKLWQVGTTGDGSPSVSLLATPVTSGPDGSFSITANYTCPSSGTPSNNLVYITANGGNPGLSNGTNNSALVLMAALGQCSSLSSTTFISLNEVTTIGSLAALYPYATSYTAIGAGSGDAAAFVTAFGLVPQYVDTTSGYTPGPSLPSGYYASSTELNTLGNIVASCINSAGGVAGDSSPCGNLFSLAAPPSGPAPTDTVAAVIDILNNPTHNVSGLFNLGGAIAPFQPSLGAAPATWALPIVGIAATPTFSVAGGTYSSAQFVTLSDTTPGAVIHYTIDGSTPTSSSPTYSGTITVSSPSETIQAIAVASGYANSAVASATYIITGSTATYTLGGQAFSTATCGSTLPPITMTLKQGSIVVQTTTTSNGLYTFSGVPNGTYSVTPSISGPASFFYPAAATNIVINGANKGNVSFGTTLGYTVSGTVAYSGSQTGHTYLVLTPTCGGSSFGTSISTKGAFTIQGVPPGSYTLQSYMDNIGKGSINASNPAGSTSVTVTSSNYSGANVTLADPTTVTLSSAPGISGIAGLNSGALVQYTPILNSNNVEKPTSYTLQWSTSSSFSTITDSQTFPANGTNTDVWLLNSGRNASLTDGSVYYFRAYGTSAGTAVSPYSAVYGPVTIGAPTGGNTVTGAISYTGTATGPLYTGLFDQSTGNFYGTYISGPASAQAYSVQAPNGSNYLFVGVVDQNNDGLIDAGDFTSVNGSNGATVISGPTANLNLTLPGTDATAAVTTHNFRFISGGTSQSMNLTFQIDGVVKQPVAVTLASGPRVLAPVDLATCVASNGCNHGFQASFNIASANPIVGDTYTFNVTYSDGSTGTVTAVVTGTVTAFATNLSPQTGGSVSTTPTFTWTDPANASNYTYSFSMYDTAGHSVWQIPGPNSNSNGFSSAITSIVWGVDPTDSSNTPSPSSLVLGTTYNWGIQVQDGNGNAAQTMVVYQP